MQRRVFLKVIAAAAAVAGCGTSPSSSPDAATSPDAPGTADGVLDLSDPANAALTHVGGSRIVRFAGTNVIVARVSDTEFVAVSSICTHAGCSVRFATSEFSCPCHGSLFALDGSVLRGPATRPLAKHTATFDAQTNIVTLS